MSNTQIKNVRDWHEDLITTLIANPQLTQREVARHYNVTEAWLSTVIHSDAFRNRLAQRRDELHSAVVTPIADRLHAIAHKSLERLERLVDSPALNDPKEFREIAVMAMNRIGFSEDRAPSSVMNVNYNQQNNNYFSMPQDKRRDIIEAARRRVLSATAPLALEHTAAEAAEES